MTDALSILKELISTSGLSGYESEVREVIQKAWSPLVDELNLSKLGSLHGFKHGAAIEPRPKILIATHMDAIGLMVTGIEGEFLRISHIGGIDPRILPGQLVKVHAKEVLPALVIKPPDHLLPESAAGKPVEIGHLFVDTGLTKQEVAELVTVGDLVSFAQEPVELAGDVLVGHSLDNRASVAALTFCLQELQTLQHQWDVWAVASVQEEVTYAGAYTSGYEIRPDLAVIIDVTFATGPGTLDYNAFPLESGPALGWGPVIHPVLFREFKKIAEELEIPHNKDVLPKLSWTDADALQVTAEGIPSMLISIPLRYMHTPVEMIAFKDITRTGRLLAEFIAKLPSDFLKNLSWD